MQWGDLGSDRVFSSAQAAAVGLEAGQVRRAVRSGQIRRLRRGWFTSATQAKGEDLLLLRTVAAVRDGGAAVAASHHCALLVHSLPLVDCPTDTVYLAHLTDRHHRVSAGVRYGPAPATPVWVRAGTLTTHIATMPAAVAVVQTGCAHGPRAAIAAADAALRLKRTTQTALSTAVKVLSGHTGIGLAKAALVLADGRRESPGESLLALVLHQLGIEVEPQIEIPDGYTTWRADFQVRGHRVLIEFDGKVKYASREDLWREKKREDRLRDLGWEIVRVTWADLSTPGVVADRIRRAIARSTPAAS